MNKILSYKETTPSILYQDEQILVGFKPAGMATQGRKVGVMDFESYLKNHLSKEGHFKKEPFLGLVHRLDQPVSGLLVFGKTKDATRALNRQLQSNQFQKLYRALTLCPPTPSETTLVNYLAKEKHSNLSFVTPLETSDSKLAILHYKEVQNPPFVFEDLKDLYSAHELEIQLKTGRHHQIRVQLAHANLPILGDQKYNPSPLQTKSKGALCLCAYRLSFRHPKTNQPLSFSIV